MKKANPTSLGLLIVCVAFLTLGMFATVDAQSVGIGMSPLAAEAKARETEAKMTDDERFGLIKNLMVVNFKTRKRDDRVPADLPQLAGWTPWRAKTRHSRSGHDGCEPWHHQSREWATQPRWYARQRNCIPRGSPHGINVQSHGRPPGWSGRWDRKPDSAASMSIWAVAST